MQISHSVSARNSEDEFARGLRVLSDSGSGLIHVRTHEVLRAAISLRRLILVEGDAYHEWDVQTGFKKFDASSMYDMAKEGDNTDLGRALHRPVVASKEPGILGSDNLHYFVYLNPQYWLDGNPQAHHLLQQAAFILPATNVVMILVTPDIPLPAAIADFTVTLRFSPPGHSELLESINNILGGVEEGIMEDVEPPSKDRIGYAGAGMSKAAFETYMSQAIVETGSSGRDGPVTVEDIIAGINRGKTEIVNRNDLLELYPAESMDNVGGMDNLKEWVSKRSACYSEEAKEYGIEPPKGMVIVGIPGTGKSLAAKAISKELGVPLIRMDFGRVFNSLVGASEERIRTALKMVEAMAPCVLFCDEIDKGLGGIGGTGDSGTSSRVLGTFLTWLQDNTAPVFTMVTANNIGGLPPELLRRGRFDAIFSSTLPDEHEREEVLKIHLNKRGWDPDLFERKEILEVVNASGGYVPAEIESAIKDGLINAFSADEDFDLSFVVDALNEIVPLSKSHAEAILAIQTWAESNATPASKKRSGKEDSANVQSITKRRTRTKRTH